MKEPSTKGMLTALVIVIVVTVLGILAWQFNSTAETNIAPEDAATEEASTDNGAAPELIIMKEGEQRTLQRLGVTVSLDVVSLAPCGVESGPPTNGASPEDCQQRRGQVIVSVRDIPETNATAESLIPEVVHFGVVPGTQMSSDLVLQLASVEDGSVRMMIRKKDFVNPAQ